jgi:hypothetical protein
MKIVFLFIIRVLQSRWIELPIGRMESNSIGKTTAYSFAQTYFIPAVSNKSLSALVYSLPIFASVTIRLKKRRVIARICLF